MSRSQKQLSSLVNQTKNAEYRKQSEVTNLYHHTSTRIIGGRELNQLPNVTSKKIIKSSSRPAQILSQGKMERNITNIKVERAKVYLDDSENEDKIPPKKEFIMEFGRKNFTAKSFNGKIGGNK